jgi:hypothetical protein
MKAVEDARGLRFGGAVSSENNTLAAGAMVKITAY